MTAHAMKSDGDRCLAAGMDDYVTKPVNSQRLAEVLNRLAGAKPAQVASASTTAPPAPVQAASERVQPHAPQAGKAPFDSASLLQRCMSKPSIALRVLAAFEKSSQELVGQLGSALAGSDTALATRLAHTLKGASANVSAEGLRALAATLEQQCKAGAEAAARTTLMPLQAELARCLASLGAVRADLSVNTPEQTQAQ
jgi:HPt (histidine-containing phosphotransfer) domain-containing protein